MIDNTHLIYFFAFYHDISHTENFFSLPNKLSKKLREKKFIENFTQKNFYKILKKIFSEFLDKNFQNFLFDDLSRKR